MKPRIQLAAIVVVMFVAGLSVAAFQPGGDTYERACIAYQAEVLLLSELEGKANPFPSVSPEDLLGLNEQQIEQAIERDVQRRREPGAAARVRACERRIEHWISVMEQFRP